MTSRVASPHSAADCGVLYGSNYVFIVSGIHILSLSLEPSVFPRTLSHALSWSKWRVVAARCAFARAVLRTKKNFSLFLPSFCRFFTAIAGGQGCCPPSLSLSPAEYLSGAHLGVLCRSLSLLFLLFVSDLGVLIPLSCALACFPPLLAVSCICMVTAALLRHLEVTDAFRVVVPTRMIRRRRCWPNV